MSAPKSAAAREALARDLKETRGNLESVGSANLDALLLLDKNRQIVWGNQVAWEMFGGKPAAPRVELHQLCP